MYGGRHDEQTGKEKPSQQKTRVCVRVRCRRSRRPRGAVREDQRNFVRYRAREERYGALGLRCGATFYRRHSEWTPYRVFRGTKGVLREVSAAWVFRKTRWSILDISRDASHPGHRVAFSRALIRFSLLHARTPSCESRANHSFGRRSTTFTPTPRPKRMRLPPRAPHRTIKRSAQSMTGTRVRSRVPPTADDVWWLICARLDAASGLITIDGTMELCGDLEIDPENVSPPRGFEGGRKAMLMRRRRTSSCFASRRTSEARSSASGRAMSGSRDGKRSAQSESPGCCAANHQAY